MTRPTDAELVTLLRDMQAALEHGAEFNANEAAMLSPAEQAHNNRRINRARQCADYADALEASAESFAAKVERAAEALCDAYRDYYEPGLDTVRWDDARIVLRAAGVEG